MNMYSKMVLSAVLTSLAGCSPSGGSDSTNENNSPTSSNSEVVSTQNIVADSDFNFRSDRSISMTFGAFPSEVGKFVIYSQYAYYDIDTNTYYPDYDSRVASFIASTDLSYDVMLPSSQQFLVLEWLPMDGESDETYRLLALNDADSYQLTF